jgi:hypothetical protein
MMWVEHIARTKKSYRHAYKIWIGKLTRKRQLTVRKQDDIKFL